MIIYLLLELYQIGEWRSRQGKLQLSSIPQQNKQATGLVPLDKLNRRLKVVVVKVRNLSDDRHCRLIQRYLQEFLLLWFCILHFLC